MIKRKGRLLTIFILITLLVQISKTSSNPGVVDLKQIAEDDNEGLSFDFKSLWLGEDQDYLVIVLDYFQISGQGEMGASVNLTIRDENTNIYLVKASMINESFSLTIFEGVSLLEPVKSESSSGLSYGQQQIYFNPNRLELGFFINWDHIGGQGKIDLVIWTTEIPGVSPQSTHQSDSIPNGNYLSFDGVDQTDRVLDLNDAIAGNFEQPTTSSMPSSGLPSSETPNVTTSREIEERDPGSGLMSILVIFFILFFVIYFVSKNTTSNKKIKPLQSYKPKTPVKSLSSKAEMKFIPGLGRKVRMCCYQTARLSETYCYCGRAVAKDLQLFFDESL